ncbi:MAG TPA: DNA repair protein RadA [Anaerolineales bacterium]|nr:DNA repair protein RadA [Anaerolineales bacterium]
MAKSRTQYICQECGRTAPKALGRCPQCDAWGSMVEEVVAPPRGRKRGVGLHSASAPKRLSEVASDPEERIPLRIAEFARVLGGGIVPGSVVLIGGDPGIGKSTLLLQMALAMSERERVLYVSGEESERQMKTRAHRLAQSETLSHELFVLAETDLESITQHTEQIAPSALVIDSIQTMHFSELESSAGSITQVRECAARLQRLAKSSGIAIFLVGHVTKEGAIAGPRVMEHIVDTVLYLEGDPYHAYRILRSVKNRFGPTSEVGVFEMQQHGLVEVPNPSEAFLAERVVNAPGSAVAVTMEGTRPLLVEIQGLTSKTSFGNPRRTANGIDIHRLLLTVAVLSRRVGIRLDDQDVFINVVGGLQIGEPAADLATAIAIASSLSDKPVPADVALIGEVGLTGELRAVAQIPARLQEAAKLGFKRVVIPKQVRGKPPAPKGLEIISARSVREVSALLLE